MIARLARYLRRLRPVARTVLTHSSGEGYYRFPVADARQFQCFVVEPDGREHWIVNDGPDDWTYPPRGRQHQFGGHPDIPFEGLAQ